MPRYDDVPESIPALADEVISSFHPELAEAGVSIGFLLARSVKGESAVKLHGYPCKATVKINSYKDRKEGKADATITVDGDGWFDWSDEEQRAVIDHEITHLTLKRDKAGEVKRDELARPKLAMRLHDVQIGAFAEVAERHGQAAAEVQLIEFYQGKFGQLFFPWGEEHEPKGRGGRARKRAVASGAGLDLVAQDEVVAVAGAVG